MKLVVREAESEALVAAIAGRGPAITSVVGELETVRVCRRAAIPVEQVERLRDGLVVAALEEGVRRLAVAIGPPTLRTLDAIHLATAVSLRGSLDAFIAYDARLLDAARSEGLNVLCPT